MENLFHIHKNVVPSRNLKQFIQKKSHFIFVEMGFVIYNAIAASAGNGIWFRNKSSKVSCARIK